MCPVEAAAPRWRRLANARGDRRRSRRRSNVDGSAAKATEGRPQVVAVEKRCVRSFAILATAHTARSAGFLLGRSRDGIQCRRDYSHDVNRNLTAAALVVLAAAIAGCYRNHRTQAEIERLAREEQARRARLPTDGRELDAHWQQLRVTAHTSDGVIVGSMTLQSPKVRLFSYRSRASRSSSASFPDAQAALRKLTPIDVNDIDIYSGQVVVAEMSEPTRPELWIHELEVSLENVGTRPRLQDKEPVLLTVRGRVQGSATLVGFVTIDPWGNGLDFAVRMRLTNLRSEELYGFLKPQVGVRAPAGIIDVYIAFESVDGRVHGGVKPIAKNVHLQTTGSACSWFKATIGNFFVSLLGRGPRNRVATVIPIDGRLSGPTVEVWPTVLGILYDSFIAAIGAGFGGLSPTLARTQRAAPSQSANVLVGGNRPLAQPHPQNHDGSDQK